MVDTWSDAGSLSYTGVMPVLSLFTHRQQMVDARLNVSAILRPSAMSVGVVLCINYALSQCTMQKNMNMFLIFFQKIDFLMVLMHIRSLRSIHKKITQFVYYEFTHIKSITKNRKHGHPCTQPLAG